MNEINYFYIDQQGNQQGPRSIEQLKNSYVITPETMVWRQGMAEWCKASTLPDFAEIFIQAPPTSPTYINVNNTINNKPVPDGERPHTWLIETILATLFCCFAFGIAGIIFASKVDNLWNDGKYEQARSASSTARLMLILSVVSAVLLVILYFAFFSAAMTLPFLAM